MKGTIPWKGQSALTRLDSRTSALAPTPPVSWRHHCTSNLDHNHIISKKATPLSCILSSHTCGFQYLYTPLPRWVLSLVAIWLSDQESTIEGGQSRKYMEGCLWGSFWFGGAAHLSFLSFARCMEYNAGGRDDIRAVLYNGNTWNKNLELNRLRESWEYWGRSGRVTKEEDPFSRDAYFFRNILFGRTC